MTAIEEPLSHGESYAGDLERWLLRAQSGRTDQPQNLLLAEIDSAFLDG